MIYNTRSLSYVGDLADNTRVATQKLYTYAKEIGFDILIYHSVRTLAEQKANLANGKSKTLKSFHLVGQAFDYVPVDAKGNAQWGVGAYTSAKGLLFIKKAKSLGFTWGGDWDNDGDWRDEKFLDSPHMQFNHKGYGTDTFGKKVTPAPTATASKKGDDVTKEIQSTLNSRYSSKLTADGIYGDKTRVALLVALKKELNTSYAKVMGRTIGVLDGSFGATLETMIPSIRHDSKAPKNLAYILQASLYLKGRKELGDIDGVWGAKTTTAIKNHQRLKGLTQDGIVSGKVWKSLLG